VSRVAHVVYLHGFTSSPASSKAMWFGEQLRARGVSFSCPDFNEPAFETLTISRMLEQTAAAVRQAPEGPVALIGSSLGAFVAVHAADRDSSGLVDRTVLLAPALDFGGNRLKQLGPHGIDDWKRQGYITLRHYAYGEDRRCSYHLYEDAAQYDALAVDVRWPALAFQGRQDELVETVMVEKWASHNPRVELHVVDDGHQLSASLPAIWAASTRFLGL
jgi:uncharacterized protein